MIGGLVTPGPSLSLRASEARREMGAHYEARMRARAWSMRDALGQYRVELVERHHLRLQNQPDEQQADELM